MADCPECGLNLGLVGVRAISFVGSHKGTLCRVLEEAGCRPTKKAELALTRMPYRFFDWLEAVSPAVAAVPDAGTNESAPDGTNTERDRKRRWRAANPARHREYHRAYMAKRRAQA